MSDIKPYGQRTFRAQGSSHICLRTMTYIGLNSRYCYNWQWEVERRAVGRGMVDEQARQGEQ